MIVVAMGPGVVGSGSPLGTTAVEVAAVLDATAALEGLPIAAVRMSSADERPRHQGVSHHAAHGPGPDPVAGRSYRCPAGST